MALNDFIVAKDISIRDFFNGRSRPIEAHLLIETTDIQNADITYRITEATIPIWDQLGSGRYTAPGPGESERIDFNGINPVTGVLFKGRFLLIAGSVHMNAAAQKGGGGETTTPTQPIGGGS